jgi:predicted nucleic acid-binding protein
VILQVLLNAAIAPGVTSLIAGQDVPAAPTLVDYEVMSGLRRLALAGEISADRTAAALAALASMRIDRHAIDPFIDRIWPLRRNMTVHDASYIALAERLGVPFCTQDKRLAKARGHAARVIVL